MINKTKTKEETLTKVGILIMFIVCPLMILAVESWPKRPAQAKITHTAPMAVEQATSTPETRGRLPENPDKPLKSSWYPYWLNNIEWSRTHNTAASRDLERYSYHTVTNVANGKSVVVFINDFGPKSYTGRAIDLSQHAFAQIASLGIGEINVIIN